MLGCIRKPQKWHLLWGTAGLLLVLQQEETLRVPGLVLEKAGNVPFLPAEGAINTSSGVVEALKQLLRSTRPGI